MTLTRRFNYKPVTSIASVDTLVSCIRGGRDGRAPWPRTGCATRATYSSTSMIAGRRGATSRGSRGIWLDASTAGARDSSFANRKAPVEDARRTCSGVEKIPATARWARMPRVETVLSGNSAAGHSSLLADDDRFGQAVVRALVIGVEEVLQKAEAALQG